VLEEARLRSFNKGPQIITVVTGRAVRVKSRDGASPACPASAFI
jgi:hypothetical protein